MRNMRTENSVKNSLVAVFSNVLVMLLGFVIQTVFIKTLGEEYLGINGLFNNIISMLAIVELGIGPAIVSNLYKPLAENDHAQIKSLLKYYRNSYAGIGVLVLIVGALIMPFIKYFVNTTLTFNNFGGLYLIFYLFVLDAAFSYFYSHKRSIIQADQQNRVINLVHLICYALMIGFQIGVLLATKDFILFLIVKIFFRVLENIILSYIVDKRYPYLKGPSASLSEEAKQDIFTKVKGLIYHKLGGYMVLGTDNIIISTFLGVGTVGLYSNYYLIINSLYILYGQIFSSITASVGNLLVSESKEASFEVYKKVMFLNFWIYGFSSAAIFCIMAPFISVWLGEKYILSAAVLFILVVNFYMLGMRSSIGSFKDAAGIFHVDRFIPILESLINIVASLIFVKFFGLFGVFLGTFTSSLIVVFYSLPHFAFKKIFGKSELIYHKLYFKYGFSTLLALVITFGLFKLICLALAPSAFIQLVISAILSAVIPNLLFTFIYRKTPEFAYFKEFIMTKLLKRGIRQ